MQVFERAHNLGRVALGGGAGQLVALPDAAAEVAAWDVFNGKEQVSPLVPHGAVELADQRVVQAVVDRLLELDVLRVEGLGADLLQRHGLAGGLVAPEVDPAVATAPEDVAHVDVKVGQVALAEQRADRALGPVQAFGVLAVPLFDGGGADLVVKGTAGLVAVLVPMGRSQRNHDDQSQHCRKGNVWMLNKNG